MIIFAFTYRRVLLTIKIDIYKINIYNIIEILYAYVHVRLYVNEFGIKTR